MLTVSRGYTRQMRLRKASGVHCCNHDVITVMLSVIIRIPTVTNNTPEIRDIHTTAPRYR